MTLYQLYDNVPVLPTTVDDVGVSVGTEFLVTAQCWLTQLRWIRGTDEATGMTRQACLYRMDGSGNGQGFAVVDPVDLPTPAQGEWGVYDLPVPFELTAGLHYKAVVFHPAGRYTSQSNWFDETGPNTVSLVKGPITVLSGADTMGGVGNGTYGYGNAIQFPWNQFHNSAYFPGATISDVDPTVVTVPRLTAKRYEDGGFVSHSAAPKVWDGSSWIPAVGKRWDDSGWVALG